MKDVDIVVSIFCPVDVPAFTKVIAFSYKFSAKLELHLRFVPLRLKMIQGLHTPTRWSRHQPTLGVLVAMSRLSDIVHGSAARTVVTGAGPI